MKLQNKKTGEIKAVQHGHALLHFSDGTTKSYKTVDELNEEWQDYEEPKEYWYYDTTKNGVDKITHLEDKEKGQAIGNHFETREEAEKACDKLKAWKRLKDYNVKFNLDFVKNKIDFTYSINNPLLDVLDGEEQIFNNMKIVFGGEE